MFQDSGCQALLYFGMEWDGDSLKAGIECFEANMPSDLLDKMIVPMPAEAGDQVISRYLKWSFQAAKTNWETTCASRTSNLSQSSS
jgi:hypothetical protein